MFSKKFLVWIKSASICFLSVISRIIPRNPTGFPSESFMRDRELSTCLLLPSFLNMISYSNPLVGFPVLYTLLKI